MGYELQKVKKEEEEFNWSGKIFKDNHYENPEYYVVIAEDSYSEEYEKKYIFVNLKEGVFYSKGGVKTESMWDYIRANKLTEVKGDIILKVEE